jgi:membrane fusion protein, multidrug efflux system
MKANYFLVAGVFVLISACRRSNNEEPGIEVQRVRVKDVSHGMVILPIHSTGILASSQEIKLSFKTGGIIAHIYAEEGMRVRKGELLAVLDPAEIESLVRQAGNAYDKALRDYSRAKNLYADSVATLEQLQNAETAVNVAKASLDMANFNMDHSRIYAPDNGTILKRLAENNEMIAAGYPVFLFGTTGKNWKIKTGLSDRNFVKVMTGDTARVTIDAWPDVTFKASVSQISEAANPMTGTYEIELDLQKTDRRLASGFIVNLDIYSSDSSVYQGIPFEAVVEAEGHTGYVYTVTDSMTARKKMITIAAVYDSYAAISEGLEGVSRVVTEGAAYLAEGDKVEIIE